MKKILIVQPWKTFNKSASNSISMICKGLEKRNIKVDLISLQELLFIFGSKGTEIVCNGKTLNLKKYDLVYFRTVGSFKNSAFILAEILRRKKIKFFDRYILEIGDTTKPCQMFLLSENGIRIPKTIFSKTYNPNKVKVIEKVLKYPFIAKVPGSGGKGVSLIKNRKELNNYLGKTKAEFLFQEFIENKFDYRLLVLKNKTRVVDKRVRAEGKEFRNNACLGGTEHFLGINEVSRKIKKIAEKASKILGTQVSGVDIIQRGKNYYVIEVNAAPQFTWDDKSSPEIQEMIKFLASRKA
jgi:RimK family alpha-L-glutamate ligase